MNVHKLFRFIKRLFAYLPVLWRDEDWDYLYLLRLMQFKIKRMRESIHKYGYGVHGDKMFHRMRVVENLIDRLDSSDYGAAEYLEWEKNGKYEEEFHKVLERVDYSEENDWNMVFDTIKRYGRRWWD